ncbi:lipoprotein insertase outer membrane protein LolB [Roseateles violae]|uniref:Outer-membrane lipoprotein LolB n=1 Tax=Roseateles violae TaxID=3058042 RepID=A0ABT8DXZ2_9BURK|nr:lipoprotein insertase outer membrane protein LolB [Pelomonas sp. PFR6]MDN3922384.1 lipoprotein insertase outer membrane protein LolB [Pelomonas sp. PFR6]
MRCATRTATAALLCAAALLAGCSSLTRKPAPQVADGDLRLAGRLSVQVAGGAGGKASGGNAGFELIGNPQTGQLELSTPLGSLVARALWREREVRLQTPEDERRFDDLDALTRELLGEAIPVAALFDWLRGKPWPQAASQATANGFEQLGWQIDLARFSEGLIVATRRAEPVVTLRARIDEQQ